MMTLTLSRNDEYLSLFLAVLHKHISLWLRQAGIGGLSGFIKRAAQNCRVTNGARRVFYIRVRYHHASGHADGGYPYTVLADALCHQRG